MARPSVIIVPEVVLINEAKHFEDITRYEIAPLMDVSGITSADEHDHTYAALWASDLKSLVHLSIRIKAEWDFYAPYVPEGMKLDKAKFTVESKPMLFVVLCEFV